MALRPSSVPLRVPLPASPESSLPTIPEPESDLACAASPTVSRLLATVVTDPSFETTAASALVAELVDFAAACRLDYATALVAESKSANPQSVEGECALSTDVLEDRQEDFECLATAVPQIITGPYSSQWQAAMDAEMASWKSTGTYVDVVPSSRANIVDGMWIFRVKRPPGSPPAFKACYVARGFSQRQGVDYFHTFSPTLKMTTLRVLLHVAAQRDYELHSLDFSTAFLQGCLHEEIWLRRPPGFTGSFPAGTQWSLQRPIYGLRQAPREWHDTLRTTLAALGFAPSTADPSLFLRTDTSLPPFYVLVYVNDLVFATTDTEALTLVKSFAELSAGGAGNAGAGGAGVTTGAGGTGGTASAGPGGARTRGAGAAGTGGVGSARAGRAGVRGTGAGGAEAGGAGVGGFGAGGAGTAGAGAVDPRAGGSRGTVRPRPYFVPLLQQVLGVTSSTSLPPPLLCPPPDQSQLPLLSASSLLAPSPYTEQSSGLTERREPVRTARRTPRLRPPPVPGTHTMALCLSSIPLRVLLPALPASSLPEVLDPESDHARAASPTLSRLLASVVTCESAAASAPVAELLDFAVACRLDYATALVAESASASPPSIGGECALGTDVLEDRQEDFECLAAAVPRFASMLLSPEGDPAAPDIPTPRSYAEAITGTYIDEVLPPGANIVDGMWIFRVKRPPGSPTAFKARYIARGFSQRQAVDYFQTFSPTPKMTTLRVLLHVAAQRDYELHSLNFSTTFLQCSLHEENWLRRPPGFTGSFPAGTQWSLRRPVYGLHQAPREWHDTLRTTLAALGFAPSTADPSLFLLTDTSLLPFYVLVYVDDLVFATADPEALTLVKSQLQKRHTFTDLGELRSYLGF
ncbi:unnamed protein product [Closterium sp. NIES-53]